MKYFLNKFFAADGIEGGDFDTLTDEQINSKLAELEAEEPVQAPEGQAEQPDNSQVETPKEEITPEAKKEELTPEVKAPDNGQAETPKDVILTDEVFNALPPEKQKKYVKFKGKSINDVLDSYGNLESFVGKKKQELFTQPEKPQAEQSVVDASKIKGDVIFSELRQRFPKMEMPPTLDRASDEYKEWMKDLNYEDPDTAFEFRQARDEVSKNIEAEYERINYYQKHYVDINQNLIKEGLNNFGDYVTKELGIGDLKEYGIDLMVDAEGNNSIVDEILNDDNHPENDFLDPKIVSRGKKGTPYEGIPIINQTEFMNKLIRVKGAKLYRESLAKARSEAVEKVKTMGKPESFAPSLSGSQVKGKQKKQLTLQDIDAITDNVEVDRMLDELEE